MHYVHSLFILLAFQSCFSQQKNNTSAMEKFNIELFETSKIGAEFNRTLSNGTQIKQFESTSGYYEKIIPANGWFYEYKEFYRNGNLKIKGEAFSKGDFQSGLWVECDSNGIKTKEVNYDSFYSLTLDSVLNLLSINKIPFSKKNQFNTITRKITDSKGVWYVEWKVSLNRVETIEIDDLTGKIKNRDYYELQEDN